MSMPCFLCREASISSTPAFLRLRPPAGDRAESERRARAAAEAEAKQANESEGSTSFHSLVVAAAGTDDRPVRLFFASAAALPQVAPVLVNDAPISILLVSSTLGSCVAMAAILPMHNVLLPLRFRHQKLACPCMHGIGLAATVHKDLQAGLTLEHELVYMCVLG